jgi:hypothetical protein
MVTTPNNQLKDFQVATVEYVFQRFTEANNQCNRFLVADEVGLGKTLVARGIIRKFYDYFIHTGKSELHVIYICSNQSIASQNISRLNVESQKGFSTTKINRLNDLAVVKIDNTHQSFLKIIALSPDTSFNISRGGGIVKERAILYHILCMHDFFSNYKEKLKKIFRLDVNEATWDWWLNELRKNIRDEIALKFNTLINDKDPIYSQLYYACEERFDNVNNSYRLLIGSLRKILASVCVVYLKPDLIIMDEFQRFKYLLDLDDDSDVKLITESLFNNDRIKILLLSATPYKMYTLQSDDEQGENHFEEFKYIVDFLLNDKKKMKVFLDAWDKYSTSLLNLKEINWNLIKEEKGKVELLLRGVMSRTERITVSDDKNTMLHRSESDILWIKPTDIKCFISADSIALKLQDVNSPIEYCKSSPFPFSFMEGYQLQKMTRREIARGNIEIKDSLKKNIDSFLPVEKINNYESIDHPNAKLTYLLDDVLYNGGSELLWIPPSLPYYFFDGPYSGQENFSKTLVFSSWIMVPKMIAALSSYEYERLTIGKNSKNKYFETTTHSKDKLKFVRKDDTLTTLPQYALLYPCITLSEIWKPTNKNQRLPEIINDLTGKIQPLLKQVTSSDFIKDISRKDDERWALVYMLLLDRKYHSDRLNKFKVAQKNYDWSWFKNGEENSIASLYYSKIFSEILFADSLKNLSAFELRYFAKQGDPVKKFIFNLKLGHPPSDIVEQLAYLTIASPAICSLRLLFSYNRSNKDNEYNCFFGAFRLADSFRKFFNKPENTAVIDNNSIFNSYWKNVLAYSAQGNFQSMLDEFAYAMIDHNGLWDYPLNEKLIKLVELLSNNIGLRTVTVTGHTYESFIKESKSKHFRCHFGVALNHSLENEKDVMRSDDVRDAFNSPFRPFILTTTSIGQEGLDFHLYCRKLLHWNLPANPIDFEQREGRINRFKNLAIRQNLAIKYKEKLQSPDSSTIWDQLYQLAIEYEKGDKSDLVPFWHVEPQNIFIERQVPIIPYSKEVKKLRNILRTISVYRIALGQPRQEDLINYLIESFDEKEIENVQKQLLINLSPFRRDLNTP